MPVKTITIPSGISIINKANGSSIKIVDPVEISYTEPPVSPKTPKTPPEAPDKDPKAEAAAK